MSFDEQILNCAYVFMFFAKFFSPFFFIMKRCHGNALGFNFVLWFEGFLSDVDRKE